MSQRHIKEGRQTVLPPVWVLLNFATSAKESGTGFCLNSGKRHYCMYNIILLRYFMGHYPLRQIGNQVSPGITK